MTITILTPKAYSFDTANFDVATLNGYSLVNSCKSCKNNIYGNVEIEPYSPITAKKQHIKDLNVKKLVEKSVEGLSHDLSFTSLYYGFKDNFKVKLGKNSRGKRSVHLIPRNFKPLNLDKFDIELSPKEFWINCKILLD